MYSYSLNGFELINNTVANINIIFSHEMDYQTFDIEIDSVLQHSLKADINPHTTRAIFIESATMVQDGIEV